MLKLLILVTYFFYVENTTPFFYKYGLTSYCEIGNATYNIYINIQNEKRTATIDN